MDVLELRRHVKHQVSRDRYLHSLGVEEMAAALASRHGACSDMARIAGIVHDLAREVPGDRLLKLATDFGILITATERARPVLLHAPVGAVLARELGITEPGIWSAIELHATGGPGMSVLEQVVFVADKVERTRDYPGVSELRELADRDLGSAVLACLRSSICHQLSRGVMVHERSLAAYNSLASAGR